jgi:hypothetical protein
MAPGGLGVNRIGVRVGGGIGGGMRNNSAVIPVEGDPGRQGGGMGETNPERCNKEEDRGCQPNAVG